MILTPFHLFFMPTPHYPTAAARRAIRELGIDIRDARLRRNLPMRVLADRAFTSRTTLARIEQGDPGVSIGIYAAALHALGLLDGLRRSASFAEDEVGQALSTAALPTRARARRPRRES